MRRIIHLDMDAFYASVEERDNPSLRGKPVIVGALPGTRGVVSTCNYTARKYGVRSAMSVAEAYRRCPSGVFIKPNFKKYREASDKVHAIMAEYTDMIEFVSLDEGYMDVTGSELLFGSAERIAAEIQKRVYKTVGVTCSVGVGYSMLSAKCASEEKKPRGFFVIDTPEEFAALMKERPVGELHGVGAETAQRLNSMGIKTVGQLAAAPDERVSALGKYGRELKRYAAGIDNREVTTNAPPKSIGKETTFMKDTEDAELLRDTLRLLAEDVSYRLHRRGIWCRTVTLKLKFADMKSITRAYSGECMRSADRICAAAEKLLDEVRPRRAVRLIGISASNLTDCAIEQLSFCDSGENSAKEELDDTLHRLKSEFGRGLLKTGRELAAEARLAEEYKDE